MDFKSRNKQEVKQQDTAISSESLNTQLFGIKYMDYDYWIVGRIAQSV
jgi:hypothetical protein